MRISFVLSDKLYGSLTSTAPIVADEQAFLGFHAHLPGFARLKDESLIDEITEPSIQIVHTESSATSLVQHGGFVHLHDHWGNAFSSDLPHLIYGVARKAWLEKGAFPVHASCVGNDEEGYVLFVGHSGVGKTSMTLQIASHFGQKIFSGDRTLIRVTNQGMQAIGGTRMITLRQEDAERWPRLLSHSSHQAERFLFELDPTCYANKQTANVKAIILAQLNDGADKLVRLSGLSALHTLYPHFISVSRNDVLLAGGKAVYDGSVDIATRRGLAHQLSQSLRSMPVYHVVGSLENVVTATQDLCFPKKARIRHKKETPKKILYGVCGIGNGHAFRQLPILRHFAQKGHRIVVMAYEASYEMLRRHFSSYANVSFERVEVPYYPGNAHGLDFAAAAATARRRKNQAFDVDNHVAMENATKLIGKPDLVLSDYEPISAQYAYAYDARLVTIDQQSKYLRTQAFPETLCGCGYKDEAMRLRMFFPKADRRLACSFFQVPMSNDLNARVTIVPPVLRDEIFRLTRAPAQGKASILVYMTSQDGLAQSIEAFSNVFRQEKSADFSVFVPNRYSVLPPEADNLKFYRHGDPAFERALSECHGILSTAGHTLLSEAMYLGIPVYAIPLAIYEQQMNAHVIASHGFGMTAPAVEPGGLSNFIRCLPDFSKNIASDRTVLLRGRGQVSIIELLEKQYLDDDACDRSAQVAENRRQFSFHAKGDLIC